MSPRMVLVGTLQGNFRDLLRDMQQTRVTVEMLAVSDSAWLAFVDELGRIEGVFRDMAEQVNDEHQRLAS